MGGLDYTKWQHGKKQNEKDLCGKGIFPNCTGLFPDCPNEPSLNLSMCRTCPKTDKIKKPRMEIENL